MTYVEFINNILETRGRFACGDEYHERHHILPRSCGGIDEEDNLIDLFAREHFIAHKLLAEENPNNNSLVYAYTCMAFLKSDTHHRYILSPEEYEEARVYLSRTAQLRTGEDNPNYGNHKLAGENNPMYGKHHTQETREKISEANKNISEETRKRLSESHKGKHPSAETRKKMSEAQKGEKAHNYGKHFSEETCKRIGDSKRGEKSPVAKPVVQLTKDGEFVASFYSAACAAQSLNTFGTTITACCRGKRKTTGGFRWVYKENYEATINDKRDVDMQ